MFSGKEIYFSYNILWDYIYTGSLHKQITLKEKETEHGLTCE
jgi:hypothetical protein